MGFFEWLQNTALALKVGESWFQWVESAHVVFLAGVAGTIFLVDARLLGLASRHMRITYLSERLLPWTWAAFVGAVITGILLFMANAVGYLEKAPFLIKMGLLLIAGLNMLYFQFVTWRGVAGWDTGRAPPAARAAASVSMLCWIGVIAFGRWIGFV
jgi:hypothetical protein